MKTLTDKLNYIIDIFWQINTKNDLKNFLEDIFTPSELEILYERLQIIKFLKQSLSQREIAQLLQTSTTTVNRGARTLKYGSWVFENIKL